MIVSLDRRPLCNLTDELALDLQAVAFLYSRSQHQVDAVQFAVALAYYGLLRVPSAANTSQVDYRAFNDPFSVPHSRMLMLCRAQILAFMHSQSPWTSTQAGRKSPM